MTAAKLKTPMPKAAPGIQRRKGPDFGLDQVPKHWFGGNPFKTRFFDAMSLLFPEGEKFFIQCVRDFKDQITDPELVAAVKDFTYQEGQHGMVHTAYNKRIAEQGIKVDKIVEREIRILSYLRQKTSKEYTIAHTSAVEHFTAIMAHSFMKSGDTFQDADARMRALYLWHGVEEVEHKAVAFDVMRKVAKVGWVKRSAAMLQVTVMFQLHTLLILDHMLKVDGVENRRETWARGLWWLYGPKGLMTRLVPDYVAYYLPNFHPWKQGQMETYAKWRATFEATGGDAIEAAEATRLAA